MRKIYRIILVLSLAILAAFGAANIYAAGEIETEAEGFTDPTALVDDERLTWTTALEGNKVTLSCEDGLRSVYVQFDQVPTQKYTITNLDSGATAEAGENLFLHDYSSLEELFGERPKKIELNFAYGAVVTDIYAFSDEEPDWVQKWQPSLEKADLLLISTHSDDEQLYFAGLLPYYAIERKMNVQVVYFIQHFTVGYIHQRPHELLDGLWTVGITNYPYFSELPDHYELAEGRDRQTVVESIKANILANYGYSYDYILGFSVEVLRRFKPLVVVCHDLDGEYGHAAHILNADTLCRALEICNDDSRFPDSAAKYGTWMPEKVYLHLYDQNQIVMNWDTPYESMGDKTPFEMTQEGFTRHMTQQYPMFTTWLYGTDDAPITKASQIVEYSPCKYGLYYSSVGPDIKGGDMFENVTSYTERQRAEEEAARIAAEEEARRQAEEEAARIAAEEEARRQAEEEAARIAAEQAAVKAAQEARKTRTRVIIFVVTVILAILVIALIKRRK